ncbi:MAG: hypothetical protein ABF461_01525 [Zymomonas mobilis subsp. pomaceae]|uniref:Uncharacterized protein n=1 Tax=Zymomonas mobilis subsp. pomaceae (strain ATCC 29192 / DSM 22645 / JCM 10191 / CCUG 17912 / NBRC 13757 / NCIMB 11200 / NRRL B-4491 / Barker I) TaxID=579138 RepID=F8ERP6_ZYMMT|nr:hypothetical protein [Zymomonas mobilis]AEI37504.1 hypothetical protein Zymop_0602 [Zymomonas mobilis subsp. pomaceae ATCC 29192]MDX5948872.1 hypothetical protein [Zymomonas mobilis subsp. pomaceae]GEB88679.1 hypothetical protein ZMO02_03160 [Zymomonas mobilis subsp. pomaceae]
MSEQYVKELQNAIIALVEALDGQNIDHIEQACKAVQVGVEKLREQDAWHTTDSLRDSLQLAMKQAEAGRQRSLYSADMMQKLLSQMAIYGLADVPLAYRRTGKF